MEKEIEEQVRRAAEELIQCAKLSAGNILVVGCSTSEILGERIGRGSSMEAAEAVYNGLSGVLQQRGIFLAAQCCEHLNRAIVLERRALGLGAEIVNVIPQPHAGGSFATTAWQRMSDPVAVEEIRADAGMDIGDTLIGMHLKRVAVPVRLSVKRIGQANLVCARTRPKYIGGSRAVYAPEEELR
ncbi:TIGR01440 family protein [uncultured Ruthenibacterium sp.]|uniref:TIGR01440 family protein n=1 Tax=uncultured Ruthenibacterium sp. TaxID=1905347 RepID=UPI00349EC76E